VGGVGMFWGVAGGGDGGLVSLTLSACQAENARPKGSKNELKKKKNSLPSLGTTLLPNLTKLTKMHLRGFLKY